MSVILRFFFIVSIVRLSTGHGYATDSRGGRSRGHKIATVPNKHISVDLAAGSKALVNRYKRQDYNTNKTCLMYQFECKDGSCIEDFLQCDGKTDCADKSDETIEACSDNL